MQTQLAFRGGHCFPQTLGWIEACARRDVDLKVFVRRRATPEVLEATGATALFGVADEDKAPPSPHGAEADALAAERRAATPPDVVIFPWADPELMHGVADWLASLHPAARPGLVFHFVHPEPSWTLDDRREQATGDLREFRRGAARIKSLATGAGLAFTAVDPRLCRLIAVAGEIECLPSPLPKLYPSKAELAAMSRDRPRGRTTISLLGGLRAEKGEALYADIIAGIGADVPGAAFFVQMSDQPRAKALAESLRGRSDQVRVLIGVGPLAHNDYLRRLATSDLVLLPYMGPNYAMRPSGIFAEAAACGVPVAAPAGTWMADRLAEGWAAGEVFETANVADITAAVVRALARLPQLRAEAAETCDRWRRTHSVDAYLVHVLGLLVEGGGSTDDTGGEGDPAREFQRPRPDPNRSILTPGAPTALAPRTPHRS
jgi:glycosyltransferase involved in cell wall biosynthesis